MWSSMTQFGHDGTIPQVEFANKCALKGDPSVAINVGEFCVMASVKDLPPLAESETVQKIVDLNTNVGMTYAGFEPDFRILSKHIFRSSLTERLKNIHTAGRKVSRVVQEMTHVCGTRPYGLALIMAGLDLFKYPRLLKMDAYGQICRCSTVAAVGIGALQREDYIVDQYEENMCLRSGLLMTIESLTLDEMEKFFKPRNFEIAILDGDNGFRTLSDTGVKYVVEQVQFW